MRYYVLTIYPGNVFARDTKPPRNAILSMFLKYWQRNILLAPKAKHCSYICTRYTRDRGFFTIYTASGFLHVYKTGDVLSFPRLDWVLLTLTDL